MVLQFLVVAPVVYFPNDDQILLVRRESSRWFSLSVVVFSYVVWGWLFVFVVLYDMTDILVEIIYLMKELFI